MAVSEAIRLFYEYLERLNKNKELAKSVQEYFDQADPELAKKIGQWRIKTKKDKRIRRSFWWRNRMKGAKDDGEDGES